MELTDRIDWKAYENMLLERLAEERLLERENSVGMIEHANNIKMMEEELELIRSGKKQQLIDKYKAELQGDVEEFFQGYLKDRFTNATQSSKPQVGDVVKDKWEEEYTLADVHTLWQKIQEQYPNVVTIPLPDESFHHLMEVQEAVQQGEEHLLEDVTWWGEIESKNRHWVPEGTLKAEFKLTPDMYSRIMPDESAYPLDVLQAEQMDWEDRAATRLLHDHPDTLKGAKVNITIREDMLPYLYIENRPFPEVMQTVNQTNCMNEKELKQLLNLQNIYEQGFPNDGKIPDYLQKLLSPVTDKYQDVEMTPQSQTKYKAEVMGQVEFLLKCAHALPTDMHNLVGMFEGPNGSEKVKQTVQLINRLYAPDTAFAVRHDNKVEVSIRSLKPLDQVNIKDMLRCDPECTELKEQPFHNLQLATKAYLFCKNGQILEGHIGVEGLNTKYQYVLSNLSEDKKTFKTLLAEVERSHPENTFSTDVQIKRFFKGQMMPIAHMMNLSQFEKQQTVQGFTFAHPDERNAVEGPVWLTGKIGGETVVPRQLNEEDTKLFYRYANQHMSHNNIEIAKGIFCEAYYKDELDKAWEKEQTFRQQLVDKRLEKERLYHRITHATLYGKVDNVHVRCKIDGVQQMGRPITAEDAEKYAYWKDDAKLLGKDTLNYKNYLNQDYIIKIAANAFSDILKKEVTQEQDKGIRR